MFLPVRAKVAARCTSPGHSKVRCASCSAQESPDMLEKYSTNFKMPRLTLLPAHRTCIVHTVSTVLKTHFCSKFSFTATSFQYFHSWRFRQIRLLYESLRLIPFNNVKKKERYNPLSLRTVLFRLQNYLSFFVFSLSLHCITPWSTAHQNSFSTWFLACPQTETLSSISNSNASGNTALAVCSIYLPPFHLFFVAIA